MRQDKLLGQYFTQINIFNHHIFLQWAQEIHLKKRIILEPFAGKNGLIKMLQEIDLLNENYKSFDIIESENVIVQDTIKNFPKSFSTCITNPPFLGKNIAGKIGMASEVEPFMDLYEKCIYLCLKNCDYVAAIVPMSFITSDFFKERLYSVIELPYKKLFIETEHPVCLALWNKENQEDFTVIREQSTFKFKDKKIEIEEWLSTNINENRIKFHSLESGFGLWAIDATDINKKLRFCDYDEMKDLKNGNKERSRIIFKLLKEDNSFYTEEERLDILKLLNKTLEEYREKTADIFLTAYKGIRQDNCFRRRLDFLTAKKIIAKTLDIYEQKRG